MSTSILAAWLEHPDRPAGTLTYHELQGFLFTVASAPALVPPSDWMPVIFGGEEPEYEDLPQAKKIIGELMALYNAVGAAVNHPAGLPPDCPLYDDPLANMEDTAPVARWSRGFLLGHEWLADTWNPYVPEDFDSEFGAILMVLTFFSSKRLAEAYRTEVSTAARTLAETAETMHEAFPSAVARYAHLGRSIQRAILQAQRGDTPPRQGPRAGRNDPCPCGSGKKFKRCCGQ